MNKYILLLLVCLAPACGWACETGANYGDVSMANLPAKILVNAGSYSTGTVLFDSGQITHPKTYFINCQGSIYSKFEWSSGNALALVGDNIYSTSVSGVGIRVKVWLNITGEYDGDTNDFSPEYDVHHIGDADLYIGKPTGFLDNWAGTYYAPTYQVQLVATGGAIASNSSLTLGDPISTVSVQDNHGTMVISQLHVTGTTKIQLTPMGCNVSSTTLNFPMGTVKTSEFNLSSKVGSAQQALTLTCEPGTNVMMRVNATEAEGANPERSVMALTGGENAATGVGVQLNINGAPLSLNTDYTLFKSNRTTITNTSAEAGYSIFTNPESPGGASGSDTLYFSTNYYKTGAEVTPGEANASGTITFIYN